MKEPSRKKGAKVEGTTKVASVDGPIREKMFVTTDETGRLKMLPLRTRAGQHDDEVDSSTNATPQSLQAQFPLPKAEVPSPPRRTPQAKSIAPRWTLPQSDTGHTLVGPATQPLVGHIQTASNTLPGPRAPVIPTVPVVPTSVP